MLRNHTILLEPERSFAMRHERKDLGPRHGRRWLTAIAIGALALSPVVVGADQSPAWADGTSWTSRAAAEANLWQSVAYGDGVWVAVSDNGTNRVMTSPDGVTWTSRAAAEANPWRSVAYGNGVWVAVSVSGTNQVMRSVDASISTGTGTGADSGTPGIFLHITGPVGRSVAGSPVYYGADRVQVTSTYTLTLTPVGGNRPPVTMLAEGTIELNGSFSTSVRLDPLAPGSYDVQFTGTHRNGATLELTSRIVVGPGGEYMLIGDNIPIIR